MSDIGANRHYVVLMELQNYVYKYNYKDDFLNHVFWSNASTIFE